MTKQLPPTAEELLGHHFKYEIDQMVASLKMLGQVPVPKEWFPQDTWQTSLNNALMESFYIHARSLFEFFDKDRGAKQYTSRRIEISLDDDPAKTSGYWESAATCTQT